MSNVVALVTGASRGIGESIAIEFAKAGVNVVLNYNRHALMAERVAEKIREKYDVDVLCLKADVSKEEEVESMVNQAVNVFGK